MKEITINNCSDFSRYPLGIVFFLPCDTRPSNLPLVSHPKIKRFWHTGIIYKRYVYETFSNMKFARTSINIRGKALADQKAIYFPVPMIIEEKLSVELKSGTSCDEYVLRCLGLSDKTGNDKGDKFPDDVYSILCEF